MTNNQIFFLQKLDGLAQFGEEQGRKLTKKQIADYFDQDQTSLQQMDLICEYLFDKQIRVEGYEPRNQVKPVEKRPLEQSETDFINQYEEELSIMETLSEEELRSLSAKALDNKEAAVKLSEGMIPFVYQMAKEYFSGKALAQDLIQEGNLAMILAIEESKNHREAPFDYMVSQIRLGMESLMAEEDNTNLEGRKLANKLNQLVDAITKLKDEMQVDISIDDLAEFMEMTPGEIEDLLRVAGELSDD